LKAVICKFHSAQTSCSVEDLLGGVQTTVVIN